MPVFQVPVGHGGAKHWAATVNRWVCIYAFNRLVFLYVYRRVHNIRVISSSVKLQDWDIKENRVLSYPTGKSKTDRYSVNIVFISVAVFETWSQIKLLADTREQSRVREEV